MLELIDQAMEKNGSNQCSHSLPNLDSTINNSSNTTTTTKPPSTTVMVTYPISEEPSNQGITNPAYDSAEDFETDERPMATNVHYRPCSSLSHSQLHRSHQQQQQPNHHSLSKTKAISDTEYLCHPSSSAAATTTVTTGLQHRHHTPTTVDFQCSHHSVGTLINGSGGLGRGETNLGSRLFSSQSCDFDVVPVFSLTNNAKRFANARRISRTTRIVISTSLISFGITIMIVGILVYTVRDIEIGFSPYKFNNSANITNSYEAYLVHQTVDSIINDERRYNASVGSMFMSFGALAVIVGISLLLAPAIKKRQEQYVTPLRSPDGNNNNNNELDKNLSSIVYFNKDDLSRSQLSVEKMDLDHHGSRKEFF